MAKDASKPPAKASEGSMKKTTKLKQQKLNTIKFDSQPTRTSSLQRIDPLTAFGQIPDSSNGSTQWSYKGKQKATPSPRSSTADSFSDSRDDRLWVDIYEPRNEAQLAVHVRKVADVRHWLSEAFDGGPSGKLRKYRRILVLNGPAGTAKTTTVRVLSKEMDFEILEWRNATDDNAFNDIDSPSAMNIDNEPIMAKFEAFLRRASTCQNLFKEHSAVAPPNSSSSSSSSASPPPNGNTHNKRKLILLEDLPNISHGNTRDQFHAALQSAVESPHSTPVPIVIILSDAGARGEALDDQLGRGGWWKDNDGIIDVRTLLPKQLLQGPYVKQIRFNPIAPTLMKKALQALIDIHFAARNIGLPSKEFIDMIIESSNGDIRSAIMALQFACIVDVPSTKSSKNAQGKKTKAGKGSAKAVLESVTRREQGLFLFHLLGKVLYNKRKGDPPNASASQKDIQRDKDIDAALKDPPPLPDYLAEHNRPASRVDIETLYTESPIDTSLFSLYIHQNYLQFTNEVEEVENISEWLSWIDSSGGDAWYQSNPHQFHLLTLGTLHSLPTPVVRRSQKLYKPEFFEYLRKEKEAWDSLKDVWSWVSEVGKQDEYAGMGAGRWSPLSIATELATLLKATDCPETRHSDYNVNPPSTHRLFSKLVFVLNKGNGSGAELDDHDLNATPEDASGFDSELGLGFGSKNAQAGRTDGGWLENDEIEDFD